MSVQTGLLITGVVTGLYGISFALVPQRVQRARWWRLYTVVGGLFCLALALVLIVIPFLFG